MPDPRWKTAAVVPLFATQVVVPAITAGLCIAICLEDWYTTSFAIPPAVCAIITAVSAIVHLICYATSTLHPLVVLTLAILAMVTWLFLIIWEGLVFQWTITQDWRDFDYSYGYGYTYSHSKVSTLGKAILALTAFNV